MLYAADIAFAAADRFAYRNSADWVQYFLYNREHLLPIDWDDDYNLTETEKQTIAHSIRNFQLGESSEGANLMRLSREYAARVGDPDWVEAMKLFIGEEQRHARDLGRAMQRQGIPLARQHWSDSLFRKLRRLANLEVALAVLLAAELVATIYYPALGQATRSIALRQLCVQIVYDEQQHVRFQTQRLGKIRQNYPAWQLRLVDALYHLGFRATLIAVWCDHQPVLRASGYSFWQFYRAGCRTLKSAYAMMRAPQSASFSS